jgi:hypothetical protein
VTYLARITECEHGEKISACWSLGCPGGTTTRIDIDHAAASRITRELTSLLPVEFEGSHDATVWTLNIVDAALGAAVAESVCVSTTEREGRSVVDTVDCGTCGGTGKVDSSCPTPDGPCGYETRCPDCANGRQPTMEDDSDDD